MRDLALTIFTVLSQLTVGSFITLWLYNKFSKKKVTSKTGYSISLIIFVITVISLLVSLFHLGHPLHAYKAILNVGESWLSREIIFYSLFVGIAGISTLMWKRENNKNLDLLGLTGTVIGILAIFSQGMIYIVPAVPAWNSVFTLIFFYLTAGLLGPLFVGMFLAQKKELGFKFSKVSFVLLLLTLIMIAAHLSTMFGGLSEAALTASLLMVNSLFWVRLALLVLSILVISFTYRKQENQASLYALMFTIVIASELIGRILYYSTAIQL